MKLPEHIAPARIVGQSVHQSRKRKVENVGPSPLQPGNESEGVLPPKLAKKQTVDNVCHPSHVDWEMVEEEPPILNNEPQGQWYSDPLAKNPRDHALRLKIAREQSNNNKVLRRTKVVNKGKPSKLRTDEVQGAKEVQSAAEVLLNTVDWMFDRDEFKYWNAKYGPCSLDACADVHGTNAQVENYCSTNKSFLARDFMGECVWMNAPFDELMKFIKHFEKCRSQSPSDTKGLILVPKWESAPWFKELQKYTLVHEYPAGTELFTRPVENAVEGNTMRVSKGATKWPVQLYYADGAADRRGETSTAPRSFPHRQVEEESHHEHVLNLTSQREDVGLLVVSAQVQMVSGEWHATEMLLDCGASRSFVSRDVVQTMKLKCKVVDKIKVRMADGSISSTSQTVSVKVKMGEFEEERTFVVVPLTPSYQFILGMDWFRHVTPTIDWEQPSVSIKGNSVPLPGIASERPTTVMVMSAKAMGKLMRKNARRVKDPDSFFYGMITPAEQTCLNAVEIAEGDVPAFQALLKTLKSQQGPAFDTKLQSLMMNYQQLVSKREGLPPERNGELLPHRIDLVEGAQPPRHKLYRMSTAELAELHRQLKDMLEKGWIQASTSPFGAPVLFARKANGELRLCVDYRGLNDITVKDRYPLPRAEDLFDQLTGATIFSKLDLAQGYHQIRIHEEHVPRTAFNTRYGTYEFRVMPFGLTNAPSTFQRSMQRMLAPHLDKFVVVFLDDILIYSRNAESHLEHIRQVLDKLLEADFRLRLDKCDFGSNELEYLGMTLSGRGLCPSQNKIQAVTDWPRPKTVTEIRSFLGFIGFYRRFIRMFSHIAAPLTDLTKCTVPSTFGDLWTEKHTEAFERLKVALTTAPVTVLPQTGSSARFVLATDASKFAIGAVLMQDQGNGLQPVSFMARRLHDAETRYSTHDQELLAVVKAVEYFRHYLDGCERFTVVTDHATLTHFLTQTKLTSRHISWVHAMAGYHHQMDILYRQGDKNQADALSRRPDLALQHSQLSNFEQGALWKDAESVLAVIQAFELSVSSPLLDKIRAGYSVDPYYVENKFPASVQRDADGLFHMKDRICVPHNSALRTEILYEFHDVPSAGHVGRDRTMAALAKHFWWPHMTRSVKAYVNGCAICQRTKRGLVARGGRTLNPLPIPPRPWHTFSLDFITGLQECEGYDAVVVFVDLLTKVTHIVPCASTMDAPDVAKLYITHIFKLYGLSRVMVCDRDPKFVSKFWKSLFTELGTRLNMSTAFHPQTDGQTERMNQSVEQVLRAYVHTLHDDWLRYIPIVEFAMNSHVNRSTGLTPFEALYGFIPDTPITVLNPSVQTEYMHERIKVVQDLVKSNLEKAKEFQKSQSEKGNVPLFKVHDVVKLDTSDLMFRNQPSLKLRDRWIGPLEVIEVISPVAYKLKLPSEMECHPVFHISKLAPWLADNEHPEHT